MGYYTDDLEHDIEWMLEGGMDRREAKEFILCLLNEDLTLMHPVSIQALEEYEV